MRIKEIKGLIKLGKDGVARKTKNDWYVSITVDYSIRRKKDVIEFFKMNGLKVRPEFSTKDKLYAEEVKK